MAAVSAHAWLAAVSAPPAEFYSTMLSEPALATVARAHADAAMLWCAACDQSGLDRTISASELAAGAPPATAYACAGAASGIALSAASTRLARAIAPAAVFCAAALNSLPWAGSMCWAAVPLPPSMPLSPPPSSPQLSTPLSPSASSPSPSTPLLPPPSTQAQGRGAVG